MNTLKNIKIYMIDKNVYYKNSKEEIAINNLRLLKIFSIIAFAIYSAYYIFTYIFFRDHIINSFYLISLPIFLIFFIFALVYEKMNKIKFSVVQIISALFCVSLLVLITALSVFLSATTPSIFMAIVIMLLPLLFIFRTEFMHSLIIVAELAFIILCLIFKEPEAYIHDFF